jgi:hypothetical protein
MAHGSTTTSAPPPFPLSFRFRFRLLLPLLSIFFSQHMNMGYELRRVSAWLLLALAAIHWLLISYQTSATSHHATCH